MKVTFSNQFLPAISTANELNAAHLFAYVRAGGYLSKPTGNISPVSKL